MPPCSDAFLFEKVRRCRKIVSLNIASKMSQDPRKNSAEPFELLILPALKHRTSQQSTITLPWEWRPKETQRPRKARTKYPANHQNQHRRLESKSQTLEKGHHSNPRNKNPNQPQTSRGSRPISDTPKPNSKCPSSTGSAQLEFRNLPIRRKASNSSTTEQV